MQLIFIAAMLFAACAVIFALQNNLPVAVTFLLWHYESSLAIVLLLSLAIGGLIVALISTPSTLRRQWEIKRLKRKISEMESNNHDYKSIDATIADTSLSDNRYRE